MTQVQLNICLLRVAGETSSMIARRPAREGKVPKLDGEDGTMVPEMPGDRYGEYATPVAAGKRKEWRFFVRQDSG